MPPEDSKANKSTAGLVTNSFMVAAPHRPYSHRRVVRAPTETRAMRDEQDSGIETAVPQSRIRIAYSIPADRRCALRHLGSARCRDRDTCSFDGMAGSP